MGKVIAVMQNKGGTLKTTLVTNLAGVLSQNPHNKVLMVDFDTQKNVTASFGVGATTQGVDNVLKTPHAWAKQIVPLRERLVVLPGSASLSSLDIKVGVGNTTNPLVVLQQIKPSWTKRFTHVLVDTAPSINLLWITALKLADEIIVPLQMEHYAVVGFVKTINTIKTHNPKVKIFVVPTLFDGRTKLHKSILASVRKITQQHGITLTATKITRSVQAAKSVVKFHLPLVLTGGKSKQTQQYYTLASDLGYTNQYEKIR